MTLQHTGQYGYYAIIDEKTGELKLGENQPHEGGIFWTGEYQGDDTPYMAEIKRYEPSLYRRIKEAYTEMSFSKSENNSKNEEEKAITRLSDFVRAQRYRIKNFDPELYSILLEVLLEAQDDG